MDLVRGKAVMNRTLKLSIMLALATWGSQALAQNLGPVQMRSTMDQPLMADIPLTGVSGNLDNVHVALASEEAFARAGLNRSALPVPLSFAVAKNAAGQPVVRVTSAAPVRDTYLDFLVEVSSGSNKVVREVTMLLDPPGTPVGAAAASAPAAPAARPSRTSEVPARVPTAEASKPARAEPASRAEAVPHAEPAPHATATQGGTYGPVQRGQTLSTIARQHAGGADMNQMLVALQKANPDAFYRDNMNALKTGAILRIPSSDEIQAQSGAAALAEVRRQNESWRAGTARAPSVVADGASTGAAQNDAKAPAPKNDRLAIVPAKEGGDAASTRAGTKGGTGDTQIAGLRQELATSKESVASLKQEGAELKSRIGELEDLNAKNQRLLSLKDSEIAELQRKLADAQKQGSKPAAAPAAAATVASATQPAAAAPAPVATPAPAAAGTAGQTSAATTAPAPGATVAISPLKEPAATPPSAATPPAPAAAAPKPVAPTPSPAPVEEDPWYMQPWAWGGGAIVILLLLVAAVFGRRKPKAAPAVASSSLADRFGQEPTFGEFGHAETMDQDQREILDALAEHPDDVGLHLELVSLYYGRRDVEHFEAAAEAMFAHIADPEQPEWREVVMMGEDLAPSHPLFGGIPVDEIDEPYEEEGYTAARSHDPDEVAALEEFDLGNYVTEPEDARPAAPVPQKHSEYHFNFDLTPVQRTEAEHRPNAPDVFDVDAPESPYAEPHATPAFGEILAEEKAEERPTWSFDEEHESAPPQPPLDAVASVPRFDEPTFPDEEPLTDHGPESFSDDPVDTKLDLARAYLDMGDEEGARLMLDEVLAEGSQMQKDTAKRILDGIV